MVDFKKLLKKRRAQDAANQWLPATAADAPKQAAVEYPDRCPEFWAAVLPELDAEFVHPVRIGNV